MKIKIKNKIFDLFLNNEIVIFLSFMLLMKPAVVTTIPILNNIFNIFSILVMIVILSMYIIRRKFSKLQIAIITFICCLGFSTLIGVDNYYYYLKTYSVLLVISLYSEMLILESPKKFLKCVSILLASYIILNFLTAFIFPKGLPFIKYRNHYFLGYDNASIITVILGLFFIMYSSQYFYKKLTIFSLVLILLTFITYYIEWAASCLINISLVIFFVLVIYKRDSLKKFINFKLLFFSSLLLFLLIVVFRFQNLFSWLIVDVLHKNLTLTGRTAIWDRCFKQIGSHLFFGIGVWEPRIRLKALRIYHAHSTILNVILEGGILALIAYLNIFRVVGKKLNDNKKNELTSICIFSLFVYMISTTIDVIGDGYLFYIILNLCYYSDYLYKQRIKNIKKKKLLILSGGYLPIPAVKGGAVETLITEYLDENERIFKEDIDVVSCPIEKKLKVEVKKYKYSNFIYLKNKGKNTIYNIICRFSRKYLNKYIGSYFLNHAIDKINFNNTIYDVIICENEILYPLLLRKKFNSKIIIHLHNDRLNPKTKFYKEIISSTDKIFAVSDYIKKRVNCPLKCITTYNGIDFDLFCKKDNLKSINKLRKELKISSKDFVYIYIGRIVPEKGIEELINTFVKLNKKYKNIKLLVIGSPNFKGKSKLDFYNQMQSLKNENIIFTGFVDNNLLYEYYNLANVQIIPSLCEEAFGLTAIEALAMDKRIIVSDAGALPELVDKKYGKIVSRKKITKNLYIAMEDEYLKKYKNVNCIKDLQQFSKQEYAKRIHKNLEVL